jgi:hypothetical protein
MPLGVPCEAPACAGESPSSPCARMALEGFSQFQCCNNVHSRGPGESAR